MTRHELEGWIPVHVGWRQGPVFVDWCWFGGMRFEEPFFAETVVRAMRDPARLLFRKRTPLTGLNVFADQASARPPSGFIFHASRCGSTLVAQMLASLPENIVVSEAPPLDQVIAVPWQSPDASAEQLTWVRGMMGALGQRRHPGEKHVFIKFDCWHVHALPLIAAAFPTVPWVFLYRDPVEILVSHRRIRGMQMIPGVLDPARVGIVPDEPTMISLDKYAARVLAGFFRAALQHAGLGRNRFINFNQLPTIVWESLGGFFGIEWGREDLARLRAAAQQNAKSPNLPYADDRASKQRAADAELRELAVTWLTEPYAHLEARRLECSRAR